MKERKGWWVSMILVAVVLLEITASVNGTNEKPQNQKVESSEKKSDASDLEKSETSYVSRPYSTPNYFGNSYKSFTLSIQSPAQYSPTVTYVPTFSGSGFLNYGQNVTNSIYQQTNCGDSLLRGCGQSRYRTYDGSCNNVQNPTWGMANTRYGRLLPANYGDGVRSPTNSVTGAELPPARMVSYALFPDVDINDPLFTLVAMQWGQVITHDMALISGTTQSKRHTTRCCTDDGQLMDSSSLHDQCYPIIVPYNDPVYSKANIKCLNFVRGTTDLDSGCSSLDRSAEQLTVVTHFLDLSLVYGSSDQTAASLRAGIGGRLTVDIRNNREWLPPATNASTVCDNEYPSEPCYMAGDSRVNQNPQLTILHMILHREHNRIADILANLNPHWTDETIFQEARRIAIAEHQHISYYEWLPLFLGTSGTYGNEILYDTNDYVNDYNPSVSPTVLNEHSTAAFRYFHSLIAGFLSLVNEPRFYSPFDAIRLSDHFNRPAVIEEGNNLDDLTRGMSYQPEKDSDRFFDREIKQFLFRNGRPLGSDLRSIDIQRNRDHGLASYNSLREYCGLPRATYFRDFLDYISPENVDKLAQIYASPDDVELTVGGSLERHVEGTLSGPTFLCIQIRQFYRTRVGDRYWYERGDNELAFTIEQLNEIRKASISRLLCDNGDYIKSMQARGFQQVSPNNPLMHCDNLPSIDLSLWRDYSQDINQKGAASPYFVKK